MVKKKNIIHINRLKYIKKRRMQKYHARKWMRFFREHGVDPLWINSLKKVLILLNKSF